MVALKPSAEFLNVDLEIESRGDLAPLLAALEKKTVVLHRRRARGFHVATLELYEFSRYLDPDSCISGFTRIIERLPARERRIWDRASHRRFDIGIEATKRGDPYRAVIGRRTIDRVAALRGEVAITVYG